MVHVQLPSGFTPVTFRGMVTQFASLMPTLSQQISQHLKQRGLNVEDSLARIPSLEGQGLIQFAVSKAHEPALFIAPRNRFPSEADTAVANALVEFWDLKGYFDEDTGDIVGVPSRILPDAYAKMSVRVKTPEGEVEVIAPVVKKLQDLHLLGTDDQGRVIGPSQTQVIQWVQEHGICDFCSDTHPTYTEIVPDFLMPGIEQMSVGGWATCGTCHTLVSENKRTELLRRSVESTHAGKFTAAALKALHGQFWEAWDSKIDAAAIGSAFNDYIEDRLDLDPELVSPQLRTQDRRREAIRRMTGLTLDEMSAMGNGDILYKDVAKKLSAWRTKWGPADGNGTRRIAKMLRDAEMPKLPPNVLPHWQVALDQKIKAITMLKLLESKHLSPSASSWMDWTEDAKALRVAEVYSFNVETMHAIMQGAQSIPHDAPLQSVEIPHHLAGWFWFAEPFPVVSSPSASDTTAALLWSWDTEAATPTIRFSAYVVDDKGTVNLGDVLPSAKWRWRLDQTFHNMIGANVNEYRRAYGPGGPFESLGDQFRIGEDGTMKVIAEMSLFFLMACLWFRQTVPGTKRKIEPKLTQEPVHIERHARKRYEKEFKVAPVVRVIALRKSAASAEPREAGEGAGRHLTVRFVVDGHPRLQPYGPGRKEKKLIWIDPYPKGPADAPFKESATKVYAVVR